MVFPTREEWLDPSLFLRREHAMPEYIGGEVAGPSRNKRRRAKGRVSHDARSARNKRSAPGGGLPNKRVAAPLYYVLGESNYLSGTVERCGLNSATIGKVLG